MVAGLLIFWLLVIGTGCQSLQEHDRNASVYGSRKEDFVPTYGGGGGGKPATRDGGSPSDGNGGGSDSDGGGGTVPFTGSPLPPFNGGGGGSGGGGSGGGGGGSGGSGGGGAPGGTIPFIGGSPPSGTAPVNPAPTGGCTCFFWANHPQLWPPFLTIFSSVAAIFQGISPRVFGPGMTLLAALRNNRTDPFSQLLREGTAALLNSYAHKNFPYSSQYVKARFNSGLVSRKAAALQAAKFARINGGYGGKLDYCFF